MIVADTSALLSLAAGDTLHLVLEEFDVHTTTTVVDELEETSTYEDIYATAARTVLASRDYMTVHRTDPEGVSSSRIDEGESSCITLARDRQADFVLTDDLRALPELQPLVDAQVAISPVVLKALVKRDVIETADARSRLQQIAETRDWLEAPIYRRAQRLFE